MSTRRRGEDVGTINNAVWKIPSELMLVVNSIDKGNFELKDLIRTLIDEVRNLKTSHELLAQQHEELVEKVAASSESRLESCTEKVTETMKNIEKRLRLEKDLQIEVNKTKSTIANLWQNTINMRKQAIWNHHHAKKLAEICENLLACNPPKMPRKFLPRIINNEPESETEIRKQLSIEKFKSEITFLHSRSQRYI